MGSRRDADPARVFSLAVKKWPNSGLFSLVPVGRYDVEPMQRERVRLARG